MKQFVILHHSAATSFTDQFSSINQSHKQRGFTRSSLGYFVGYNYVIEKTGQVKQARADQERGCHTVSSDPRYPDLNATGIGICLAGDFTREQPTQQQIVSLSALTARLQQQFKISNDRILLHRDVKPTACPGLDFRAMILAPIVPLDERLDHAQKELKVASGSKKIALTRLIERIQKLLEKRKI